MDSYNIQGPSNDILNLDKGGNQGRNLAIVVPMHAAIRGLRKNSWRTGRVNCEIRSPHACTSVRHRAGMRTRLPACKQADRSARYLVKQIYLNLAF
jgi:hypothetical protein